MLKVALRRATGYLLGDFFRSSEVGAGQIPPQSLGDSVTFLKSAHDYKVGGL